MSTQEKADQVLLQAEKLASRANSWTEFSNQVFAQDDGLVAKAFPRMTERKTFYESPQYDKLNELLLALIKRCGFADGAASKKSGKFVVRVPKTIHAALEVEAKEEGVSMNQLATAKLSVGLKESTDINRSLLVDAFKQVFDGYGSDRVLVHPDLNERFLAACHSLGLTQSDYELNHILLNVRKSGKAVLPPATKKPRITDYDKFVFASEIAFRHLQRREGVSLDAVLCDPELRKRFDGIAAQLSDEKSVFKLRMGALYLRKIHRLEPTAFQEPLPAYDLRPAGHISDVRLGEVPKLPALYGFFSDDRPIFASETGELRARIERHIRFADKLFLPRWLELGCEDRLELRYFAEPSISSEKRIDWLNQFINRERPTLNYQRAA